MFGAVTGSFLRPVDRHGGHYLRPPTSNETTAIETDLTFAVVYTIRDGKIARGREYWTKEQALEAAGLTE